MMTAKEIADFLLRYPQADVYKRDRDGLDNPIDVKVERCEYSSLMCDSSEQERVVIV